MFQLTQDTMMNQEWFLEGGDVVFHNTDDGGRYFVGISARSNKEGFTRFSSFTTKECIPVVIKSDTYYHLDTCFLPVERTLLIADSLKALFDEDTVETLLKQFDHIISVNTLTSVDPWKVCNARYIRRIKTLVFTAKPPMEIVNVLMKRISNLRVHHLNLRSIMVGGGGLACSTLIDEEETTVFLTNPKNCNLRQYVLNSFQKEMQITNSNENPVGLMDDFKSMVKLFTLMDFRVFTLDSNAEVPECLYVKDVAVLMNHKNELKVFPCKSSLKERSAEAIWFRKEYNRIAEAKMRLENNVFVC